MCEIVWNDGQNKMVIENIASTKFSIKKLHHFMWKMKSTTCKGILVLSSYVSNVILWIFHVKNIQHNILRPKVVFYHFTEVHIKWIKRIIKSIHLNGPKSPRRPTSQVLLLRRRPAQMGLSKAQLMERNTLSLIQVPLETQRPNLWRGTISLSFKFPWKPKSHMPLPLPTCLFLSPVSSSSHSSL